VNKLKNIASPLQATPTFEDVFAFHVRKEKMVIVKTEKGQTKFIDKFQLELKEPCVRLANHLGRNLIGHYHSMLSN
jgi:hypothetical protein